MTTTTDAPASRARKGNRSRGKNRPGRHDAAAYWFLAPFLLLLLAFIVFPVGEAVVMSFFDWDLLTQSATNFGLDNYREMFGASDLTWSVTAMASWRIALLIAAGGIALAAARGRMGRRPAWQTIAGILVFVVVLGIHPGAGGSWNDPRFWQAMKHTIEFTVISVPLLIGVGLGMAILVNRPGRSAAFYRTALFVPYVLPVSVVTLIWIYLLNPDRGLVRWVTDRLGMDPVDFLNQPGTALPAVIVTTVWWTVGFSLVLFLAGLQDIDPSLYEASSLDGAGRWAQFVHITLPGLRNVVVLVLVTQVVASFQVFGQVYLMTRGGPGSSSLVLIQQVYQTGIRDSRLGYASAQSLVLLAVILGVSLLQLKLLRREEA